MIDFGPRLDRFFEIIFSNPPRALNWSLKFYEEAFQIDQKSLAIAHRF